MCVGDFESEKVCSKESVVEQELQALVKRLWAVPNIYTGFVMGITAYARNSLQRIQVITAFLDDNPGATPSEIVKFVIMQPDFHDDSVKWRIAAENTKYDVNGSAVVSADDAWVDETEWEDLFEGLKGRNEVAVLNFLIAMDSKYKEIELSTGVSTRRIKEIHEGLELIGKNILESSARAERELLIKKIVDIAKMFDSGKNVDEIVIAGYEETLVFQVYQTLFCVNQEEKDGSVS